MLNLSRLSSPIYQQITLADYDGYVWLLSLQNSVDSIVTSSTLLSEHRAGFRLHVKCTLNTDYADRCVVISRLTMRERALRHSGTQKYLGKIREHFEDVFHDGMRAFEAHARFQLGNFSHFGPSPHYPRVEPRIGIYDTGSFRRQGDRKVQSDPAFIKEIAHRSATSCFQELYGTLSNDNKKEVMAAIQQTRYYARRTWIVYVVGHVTEEFRPIIHSGEHEPRSYRCSTTTTP